MASVKTGQALKSYIDEDHVQKAAKKNKQSKNRKNQINNDGEDSDSGQETVKKDIKKSVFSMLVNEDDNDDDLNNSKSDEDVQIKPLSKQSENKSKKKDKSKKLKNSTVNKEDDLDELIAQISTTNIAKKSLKNKKNENLAQEKQIEKLNEDAEFIEETKNDIAQKEFKITSEMTQEQISRIMEDMLDNDSDENDRKKKKKQKPKKIVDDETSESENDNETSTVKSVAQKKKEKKERQKMDKLKPKDNKLKLIEKQVKVDVNEDTKDKGLMLVNKIQDGTVIQNEMDSDLVKSGSVDQIQEEQDNLDKDGKSKKLKKKPKGKDIKEEKVKKPSKLVQDILEAQKLKQAEEERLRKEEEERIKREEEEERLREEKERLEKERKERKKQKEKEKIQRLKAEGKFLTEKQREDRRRAQQLLESIRAQGVDLKQPGTIPEEQSKKIEYKKLKRQKNKPADSEANVAQNMIVEVVDAKINEDQMSDAEVEQQKEDDDIKDAWDKSSDSSEDEDDVSKTMNNQHCKKLENNSLVIDPDKITTASKVSSKLANQEKSEKESSSENESSESSSDDDNRTTQEKARDKAQERIKAFHEAAEAARSANKLRAPVVCVLGHVDTGKTKILDKLRRTNVQDGEAGGITQQIGATNVPLEAIREQTKMCKDFSKQELKVPGLLIIDTPGHESFSNLRSRGSSLCDLAILVVDIMHGLEPQTIESINILKTRKTPFVVALNKIDRLFGWLTNPHSDIVNTLKKQKQNTKLEFDERLSSVIVQFAEQGLNATLFSDNKNQREYISLVPTSAHTGDGIGNLMALICELTQTMLVKRLMFSEELKATVMEVKAISGLGTTIDVILVNGRLQLGQTIIVAGQEGPIVTQIRSLLMPQPMHELRVKSQFESHKEIVAAQGCKIAAKDLEKALAGLPLYVANHPDETEIYKEELQQMLKEVLGNVKISDKGVYVQASTLGSLEALLAFLKTSEIPYCGINIGPVHKKDIMKASVMLEHEIQYAVILAFDVKVEREAQELADSMGVKIFTADIIYHLFDRFIAYKEEFKTKKREELKHVVAFPCKLRVLPEHVYNSRDPIVVGIVVEAGFIKIGTLLCVPSKEFVDIGRISSMEVNHKIVEKATKGQEVCIKIDPIPGEAPKLYGRHFDHTDLLVSRLNRQSIDALKGYWREEMSKGDWQLVLELKKTFDIL